MIHYQAGVNGINEAVAMLPKGSMVKAVNDQQYLREAKQVNPNVTTVFRFHWDKDNVFSTDWDHMVAKWREFYPRFVDGTFLTLAKYIDYIEEHNEYVANSQTQDEVNARVMSARAAAWVWKNDYRDKLWVNPDEPELGLQPLLANIGLILVNAAIGNDINIGFAWVAEEFPFCAIGYHPYTKWVNKIRDSGDWRWHSGRWNWMDEEWSKQGIRVKWAFTEAGPYAGVLDGWRSDKVLGKDRELYVEAMRLWIRDVKTTAAWREGRLLGFALFTTGRAGSTWSKYWTEQPELNLLASMVAQEWKVPDTPDPPPQPPPQPAPTRAVGIDVSKWNGVVNFEAAKNNGADFVFIRCSYGTFSGTFEDPMFTQHYDKAKAAGLLVGVYHYHHPARSWEEQATTFLSAIGNRHLDLPPVLDIEDRNFSDEAKLKEDTLTIISHVSLVLDMPMIVYTGFSYGFNYLDDPRFANHDLWIANWSNTKTEPSVPYPWTEWTFWQWSSTGAGSTWGGQSTYMDLNRFNGDSEALQLYSLAIQPPPKKTFEQALWEDSLKTQVISLNPDAAFQREMLADDIVPVSTEQRFTYYDGVKYGYHTGENLATGERRVYFTEVGNWGNIRWIDNPNQT